MGTAPLQGVGGRWGVSGTGTAPPQGVGGRWGFSGTGTAPLRGVGDEWGVSGTGMAPPQGKGTYGLQVLGDRAARLQAEDDGEVGAEVLGLVHQAGLRGQGER